MTIIRSASGFHFGGLPVYATVQGLGTINHSSVGQATTLPNASTIVYSSLFIPRVVTFTGAAILNGTVTTGSMIITLYDQTGLLLARTSTGGTAQTSSNKFQRINFSSPEECYGPGLFWLGVIYNNTSSEYRSVSTNTYVDVLTGTQTTSLFATTPNVTRSLTFSGNQGPIGYLFV